MHLLRKAIKLTLLDPANAEYRRFADRLWKIYHEACRIQRDQRLSTAGRTKKVATLEDEIFDLCVAMWAAELPPGEGAEDDYRRLCNELMRLNLAKQLFTFVTAAPVQKPNGEMTAVSGTNNAAEQSLRSPAQARDTGRTNKMPAGGRRQTVIVSVFESLRQYLAAFTLSNVIEEVGHWLETGWSCLRGWRRNSVSSTANHAPAARPYWTACFPCRTDKQFGQSRHGHRLTTGTFSALTEHFGQSVRSPNVDVAPSAASVVPCAICNPQHGSPRTEFSATTDAGLDRLKGFTQLRELDLTGTQVTDAGVAKLQKALPNCKITR